MTTTIAPLSLDGKKTIQANWIQRFILFIVFLVCGSAIFVFGSNYFDLFPTNKNLTYNLALSAALLAASIGFKHSQRLHKYWQCTFAFFVASVAFLLTSISSRWTGTILGWFHTSTAMSQGIAIAKGWEMLWVILPILALTKLSGADLGSIFIKRGNLKWGLSIGGLVLFNFMASALLFFATRYTSMDKLGAALLWGLGFSFANGFMEELWLRGIFLKRFESFLGVGGSILLTSIVFSLMHAGAVYITPAAIPVMLAYCLTLGLACGYLMMKTNSIWGAVLIHAAADLFLFIAMVASA